MASPQPEKLRHIALCLPLLGLFLLMPPALFVFGIKMTLAGVPLIVLYIFGVWGGLIVSAAALARYLNARHLNAGDIARPAHALGEEPVEHNLDPSGFGRDLKD